MPCSLKSCRAPTFTTKKNSGMKRAGPIISGSRGMLRRARPATLTRSATNPALRARMSLRRRRVAAVVAVTAVLLVVAPDAMRLPVSSRNTSSSVGVRRVRSRTATSPSC